MTGVSKRSMTRRVKGLSILAARHGIDATCVAGTLLRVWCKASYEQLPLSSLPHEEALALEPSVIGFAELLGKMSLLEGSYWLSSTYAMLVDSVHRKNLAMFFTPVSLTTGLLDDLANQGVNFGGHSFFDPACGGAAFLTPIALRMRDSLYSTGARPRDVLNHIENNLYGTDLDETLCQLSKHFLRMALYTEIKKTGYLPSFRVHTANSLLDLTPMLGTVDVVVCNPPYRKMSANELGPLRGQFNDIIEAQPNLYGLFISLSVRLLRDGGHAALVTPTSFLSGQYFSKLRSFLLAHTTPLHLGMVSDRQGVFIDVEQETALTVLRRGRGNSSEPARARTSVVSATGRYTDVGDCLLPGEGRAWPIPRTTTDVPLLTMAALSNTNLADYGYKVRIGSYVWNRDTRPRFESISDVCKANSTTAIPLLWSRNISSTGHVEFDGNAFSGNEHRFVDLGDIGHSSVVRVPCVVLQRVTSNDQPRRLVAAAVTPAFVREWGGFVGENHVVILEPTTSVPALTPRQLAKLLGTRPVDRYFRCISGATNVSAFELRQLMLPPPKLLKQGLSKGLSMEQAALEALDSAGAACTTALARSV